MRRRALLGIVAALLIATHAHAGRWIAAPCDPCDGVRQWVVTVDAAPGKVRDLAWELVTPFKGWIKGVMGRERKFIGEMTEEQARSLLADPRVLLVDGRARATGRLSADPETGTETRTIGPYDYDGAGNIKLIFYTSFCEPTVEIELRVTRNRVGTTGMPTFRESGAGVESRDEVLVDAADGGRDRDAQSAEHGGRATRGA
jgi:hypothetical protein